MFFGKWEKLSLQLLITVKIYILWIYIPNEVSHMSNKDYTAKLQL